MHSLAKEGLRVTHGRFSGLLRSVPGETTTSTLMPETSTVWVSGPGTLPALAELNVSSARATEESTLRN